MKENKCLKGKNISLGFTLIELLVVISLIACVSALVVVGVEVVMGNAKNTAIKSEVKYFRDRMNTEYKDNYPASYASDSTLSNLANDMLAKGGSDILYYASADGKSYCFSVASYKDISQRYCIDQNLNINSGRWYCTSNCVAGNNCRCILLIID